MPKILLPILNGFSPEVQDIVEKFDFRRQIERLKASHDLLYHIVKRFDEINLHPDIVSNIEMGYIFEELIRRFSEQYNETAGEHFTVVLHKFLESSLTVLRRF